MNFEEKVEFLARAVDALADGVGVFLLAPCHQSECKCKCFTYGALQVEDYSYDEPAEIVDFPWYTEWDADA